MENLINDRTIQEMQNPDLDPSEFAHRLINQCDSEELVQKYLELCEKAEHLNKAFESFGKGNVQFLKNQFDVTEGIGGIYDAMRNLIGQNRRKLKRIRESFEVNEKRVFEEFESLQVVKQTRAILAKTEQLNHLFLACSVFLSNGRFKETAAMLLEIQQEIADLEQEEVLGQSLIKHLKNHLEKKVQEFAMVSKDKFYNLVFGFCSLIAEEQANLERFREKNRDKETPEEAEETPDSERLKNAKIFFEGVFLQIDNIPKGVEIDKSGIISGEKKQLQQLVLNPERLLSFCSLCMDVELFQAVKEEALDDQKEFVNKNPDLTLIRLLKAFEMFGDSSIPQDIKINMNMRVHKTLISFLQYYSRECDAKKLLILGEELLNEAKGWVISGTDPLTAKFSFLVHCNTNQRQVNGLVEALLILILGIFQKIFWTSQFLNLKILNLKEIFKQIFGFSFNLIFGQLFGRSRKRKKGRSLDLAGDEKHQERSNEEMKADRRVISKIVDNLRISKANLVGVMPSLQTALDQVLTCGENFLKDHLLTVSLLEFHRDFLNGLHKKALEEMNSHYKSFVRSTTSSKLDITSLAPETVSKSRSTLIGRAKTIELGPDELPKFFDSITSSVETNRQKKQNRNSRNCERELPLSEGNAGDQPVIGRRLKALLREPEVVPGTHF